MNKRKLFFIKGNFQLRFIIGFTMILIVAVSTSSWLIYQALRVRIEAAAYSAHLSAASSGQLFWGDFWRINLWVLGITVAVGIGMVLALYFYYESFFRSLTYGLNQLARGQWGCRVATKDKWIGCDLIEDFNKLARCYEQKHAAMYRMTDEATQIVRSDEENLINGLEDVHHRLRGVMRLD